MSMTVDNLVIFFILVIVVHHQVIAQLWLEFIPSLVDIYKLHPYPLVVSQFTVRQPISGDIVDVMG